LARNFLGSGGVMQRLRTCDSNVAGMGLVAIHTRHNTEAGRGWSTRLGSTPVTSVRDSARDGHVSQLELAVTLVCLLLAPTLSFVARNPTLTVDNLTRIPQMSECEIPLTREDIGFHRVMFRRGSSCRR